MENFICLHSGAFINTSGHVHSHLSLGWARVFFEGILLLPMLCVCVCMCVGVHGRACHMSTFEQDSTVYTEHVNAISPAATLTPLFSSASSGYPDDGCGTIP